MRCIHCGADNPINYNFCGECGGTIPRQARPIATGALLILLASFVVMALGLALLLVPIEKFVR